MKHIFFLLLINTFAFSAALESHYTLLSPELNASVIYPDIKNDFSIYTFDKNKNRKSFTSKTLIKIFESHNLSLKDNSRGVVHFERTSDIDMGPIKNEVEAYYLSHYPNMKIDSIILDPNTTLSTLPKKYTLTFKPNAHRHNHSTLQLISDTSKERFFISYTLVATLPVFKASHNINRGKILTYIDLKHTYEAFTRFTGTPLQNIDKSAARLKKRLQKGKIVYEHDVEALPSVLKSKPVYVRLTNGNVHLEFQAKSLQDGKIGDMISIQKKDKTRLKAKVVGKNLVEIE